MLIARKKKEENIAEYVLYMWQLEDLIRAYSFDIEKINSEIICRFNEPLHIKKEIKLWYNSLIEAMQAEGITEKGHLMQLNAVVQDLSNLNIALLQKKDEEKYNEVFNDALPNISEIVKKSNGAIKNEIEACFVGLYALLLMRLKKQAISEATEHAMKSFSTLLALLSYKYNKFEKGEIEF